MIPLWQFQDNYDDFRIVVRDFALSAIVSPGSAANSIFSMLAATNSSNFSSATIYGVNNLIIGATGLSFYFASATSILMIAERSEHGRAILDRKHLRQSIDV